jgi:dolichyl-phosphate beta-glucosyltransferase
MYLSVLIPAFNEQQRIEPTLERFVAFLDASGWQYEVLVADDGSSDDTAAVVERCAVNHGAIRLLRGDGNQGKGAALRRAAAASQGEWLVYCDADLPVEPSHLPTLLEPLSDGRADLVLVSRWMQGAPAVSGVPLARRLLSFVFRLLVLPVKPRGVSDTQCGFKGFRGAVGRELFERLRIDGFAFDLELLCRARRRNLRVCELALPVRHVVGSTVRPLNDSLATVRDIALIFLRALMGHYDDDA